MSEDCLRVVLVDDQALVRTGFAMVIDSQPDMTVVGQAGDGQEALRTVEDVQPDVVLMDVRMPLLDGIQATRRLLELADAGRIPAPRIIVLTTFDTDEYAVEALRVGASGFLLKDAQPEVLLDSIRTVVDGGAVIAPSTTRRLLDTVFTSGAGADGGSADAGAQDAEAPVAARDTPTRADPEQMRLLDSLTPREREVLELMARGMSNAEIVDSLVLAAPTVKTHVSRVLMKLGARDRVQAVVFAYDIGLAAPGG